jgi:hypothetical protein
VGGGGRGPNFIYYLDLYMKIYIMYVCTYVKVIPSLKTLVLVSRIFYRQGQDICMYMYVHMFDICMVAYTGVEEQFGVLMYNYSPETWGRRQKELVVIL